MTKKYFKSSLLSKHRLVLISFYKGAVIYSRFIFDFSGVFNDCRQSSPLRSGDHLFFSVGFRSTEPRQRLLILFAIKPCFLQFEYMSSPSGYQSARDEEKPVPYNLDGVFYFLLFQYLSLKEIHKVVGKHQELKLGIVPGIAMRDNLIQTKETTLSRPNP